MTTQEKAARTIEAIRSMPGRPYVQALPEVGGVVFCRQEAAGMSFGVFTADVLAWWFDAFLSHPEGEST